MENFGDSSASRQRFARLVARPDGQIDLAEGALLIAAEEYPELDIEDQLRRLDGLADAARGALAEVEDDPLLRLQRLNRFLFVESGFRGNREDYYDPRNSFLNEVLERRLGIPITLSLVLMEVGRRAGVELEGVGFPGHFLVRHGQTLLDPFDGGRFLNCHDCQDLLACMTGGRMPFHDGLLRTASNHEILLRMLNNLRGIYSEIGDQERVIAVLDRLLLLAPEDGILRRDRGLLLLERGECSRALADLQAYLTAEPGALDRCRIELAAMRAQRRAGLVN
ncbi:MAG: transglutaminase-like domain-containing protein [Acidobacteriota bacterium]